MDGGGWFRVRTKRSIAWRSRQGSDRRMVYNSARDGGALGLADPGAETAGDREQTWNEEPS